MSGYGALLERIQTVRNMRNHMVLHGIVIRCPSTVSVSTFLASPQCAFLWPYAIVTLVAIIIRFVISDDATERCSVPVRYHSDAAAHTIRKVNVKLFSDQCARECVLCVLRLLCV